MCHIWNFKPNKYIFMKLTIIIGKSNTCYYNSIVLLVFIFILGQIKIFLHTYCIAYIHYIIFHILQYQHCL